MALIKLIFAVLLGVLLLTTSISSTPILKADDACSKDKPTGGIIEINDKKLESKYATLELYWKIEMKQKSLDGCCDRGVIIISDCTDNTWNDCTESSPGPTIRVGKGRHIRVTARNDLDESTSIHWHGLLMNGTGISDGVPSITQCPIPKGYSSFTYDFYANNKSGTHWYHSHFKPQRDDGLYGLLFITDDEEDAKDVTDGINPSSPDYVLLSDWYNTSSSDLLNLYEYCAISSSAKPEPVPRSGLLNGDGGPTCNDKGDANFIVTTNVKYKFLKSDKGNRLRIINAGALVEYFFTIDDHLLKVIEVEGMRVEHSEPVHRVPIHVGQRYSVVAIPKDDMDPSGKKFWMRAEANPDCIRANTLKEEKKKLPNEILAIVHYGDPDGDPDTTAWNDKVNKCIDLDLSSLSPSGGSDPRSLKETKPDEIYNLTISMSTNIITDTKKYYTYGAVSNITGLTVYEPYNDKENTLQVLLNTDLSELYWPPARNVFTLNTWNHVVDLNLKNADTIAHPFHLHGHFFWVMETQNRYQNPVKYKTPIMRDTSTVPPQGSTKIRFVVDNPGVWAFHCHIEWHVEVGMMAQFVELPLDVKGWEGKNPGLDSWDKLCSENVLTEKEHKCTVYDEDKKE